MARERTQAEVATDTEKRKLKDERQKLKRDQKEQKKEAKRRAREIARQEEELDDDGRGSGLVTFLATVIIVVLWLAVICIVVKMDIGGFGSTVLAPMLKDVPVINKILPKGSVSQTTDPGSYGGYTSLQDAVNQIGQLEVELEAARVESSSKDAYVSQLEAEVERLQAFEEKQTELERVMNDFYNDVIYAEKGPGPEEYRKYYEEINPTTAEFLYKQVVAGSVESQKVQDFAAAYSSMEPAAAAKILEADAMTDNLNLAAHILMAIPSKERGAILAAMDPEVAARLTTIMNPGA